MDEVEAAIQILDVVDDEVVGKAVATNRSRPRNLQQGTRRYYATYVASLTLGTACYAITLTLT